jgi:alkylation response protein AidB-like acyl-CoA dehydrogenase
VEETWDTVGMIGTGTHTIVIDREVFVPEHRLQAWAFLLEPFTAPGPTLHPDEVIYKTSGLTNGLMLAAPMLGEARAALEYVVDRSSRRGITYSPYLKQDESVTFQLQVGDASMKIQTAEMHFRQALTDLEESGNRGVRPDFATSSRVQAQCGYVAGQLRDALEILMSAHGTASFASSCPLQRYWRDVNTAGRHGFFNAGLCRESYGRSVLGQPTIGPLPEMP